MNEFESCEDTRWGGEFDIAVKHDVIQSALRHGGKIDALIFVEGALFQIDGTIPLLTHYEFFNDLVDIVSKNEEEK